MIYKDSFKIDKPALEEMQGAFFKCTHTYGYCLDQDAVRITGFWGGDRADDYFAGYVTPEMEMGMIAALKAGTYEDVVRMDTGQPEVLMGGISIRNSAGHLQGVMVILGAVSAVEADFVPTTVSEEDYESALEMAAVLLSRYYMRKNEGDTLAEKLLQEKESSQNLESLLKKSELITGVLKRMESDDDFPKVSEAILSDAGEYLGVSNAFLLRLSPDEKVVDMISEWAGEDHLMPGFLHMDRDRLPFFSGRPYTVSSDAVLPEDFKVFFEEYDITAGVFLPLFVSDRLGMYICFVTRGENRLWSKDDMVIINDIKRIMQTILTKRITKNSLAGSYAVLDAILENTGCGVCVKNDSTGELLYTNEFFSGMFKEKQDLEEFGRYITSHDVADRTEYFLMYANIRCQLTCVPIKWVDGRPATLCTLYDVTALYDYQKKLEEQSLTDGLTGLKNRACFESEIRDYIRDSVRAAQDGYLLYIDLDDFKDINDSLGHSTGDEILGQVADSLSLIVKNRGAVYRMGGDEYAVIIPHQTADPMGLIESISRRFLREFSPSGGRCYCGASIAVVRFPSDGTRVDTLMQKADITMWSAKSAGKGRVEHYSQGDDVRTVRRLSMEQRIKKDVGNDCSGFYVCLAPLMGTLGDRRGCVGAKASLKWKTEELGEVEPEEFMPLAEYLGLALPIEKFLFKKACAMLKYWNDFGNPGYRLEVDLSVNQLLRSDIEEIMDETIESSGADPKHITINFREWGTSYYETRLKRAMERISKLGVKPVIKEDTSEGEQESYMMPEDFENIYVRR